MRNEADVGDNLLPFANIVASLLKRWLMGMFHGEIQSMHLGYYLEGFDPKVGKFFKNGNFFVWHSQHILTN